MTDADCKPTGVGPTLLGMVVMGFLSGNAVCFFYVTIFYDDMAHIIKHLGVFVLGCVLFVGLVGVMAGFPCGLTMMEVLGAKHGRWPPILVSTVVSGALGWLIVRGLESLLTW